MTITDHISLLAKDKRARMLILGALLIVAMSFFRTLSAGTIRVDLHGLSGIPVLIVFSGFIAGLCLYSYNYYKLWDAGELDAGSVRVLALGLSALFSLMLPMMSNDIFSLLAYGDAANRGVDVYTDVKSLVVSPYFDYVSYLWKTAPCVYGPISLGTSRLACLVSGGHILVAIAAYKVLVFLWSVLFIEVIYRTALLLKTTVKPLLFIVLNPVFLLQGVAQLHCDMLAITLCACMVYFFFRKNWYLAFIFAGFSILAKMNFILMLGFLIVALFIDKENWKSFFYKATAGLWITAIVLFVLYYPAYTSADTFKVPFSFLFDQNPAKSIAEVMGDVVYFAPLILSGRTQELNGSIHSISGLPDGQLAAWLAVKKACQLFAMLMCAIMFFRFWFGQRDNKQWMRIFLRCLLLFLLFYSHVFYAWYLMILLPFVWFDTDRRFMQWLFVLTCFSNVHDIMCAVNRGTPVYFVVLPLTFLSVLVFFWRFRNNFFTSLQHRV